MSGPRFASKCELCRDRTVPIPRVGRMGRRPCAGCPGMHAVCPDCAKEWGLIGDYWGRDPWAVCLDAVKVAIELMRPERPPIPPYAQANFDQLQRDIVKQMKGMFLSTTKDFTSVAEVFKDVVKATGASAGDFVAALEVVREAAFADEVEPQSRGKR